MYAFISLAEEVMSTKTTTLLIAILLTGNLFAGDDPDTSSARSNNVVLTLGLSSAGIEERAFVAADDYCPYLECPIIFPCERRFLSDGRIQFRECSIIMKTVSADSLFDGKYYLATVNANFDSDSTGPIWGSFQSCSRFGVLLEDGWTGVFDGQVFNGSSLNRIIYRSGHGIGDNENLTFESASAWTTDDGSMVGVIRNTRKN